MITIKRIKTGEYVLLDSNKSEITRYQQATLTHPNDWIDDAKDAGEAIAGPYDWEYVDARDTEA